ncbi:carboxy terminal-processing peptidase [Pseudomarimonas salicorniae]|uniref:Carboxy terminal-processing peptidase n=1 Tax=Pseudomarimonas salicorniae TaxID=2933270 RepID=A0ABT0GHA6_9GAMM|nr:carboxy terminal-processing peptidase [Lysobacter sp. CAU 1642]MCK7593931.1 carboxy terminal-processing peptidase [Lysobacter sp. CAU 1642]
MKRGFWIGLLLVPLLATAKVEDTGILLEPGDNQAYVTGWVRQFLSQARFHYSPKPLDDALSAEIFDAYLDGLDGDRLFFLKQDIERFAPLRASFDDALQAGNLQPAFDIFNVYIQRVAERTAHARALLKQEFDFTRDEEYHFRREDLPWESSRKALDEVWRQRVKNDYLRLVLAGKEPEAIVETLDKRYANFEQRVREIKSDDVFQSFINAYAGAIEPHTAYMNARASENFNISMRLSLEGIGAVLQRDDEFTVIRSIVKGGPADMSGKLKVGDRVAAVGQGREGPMIDVVGWRIDDVVELIRGPKDSYVRLDVIPAATGIDGPHEIITLARQKVKLEEQAAKKRVIEWQEGERTRKVGVIELPTFYQDFDGRRRDEPDYRSASRDVARLIDQLKGEKVEGLVIDLRNNGGGSLTEAIELTGLFIDRGPVVQVRNQGRQVQVEQDFDSGTLWDGPLAVLVNRASASASEIFAAAIQDYGRGLIIGEPTFGKGTVQNLVDLDRFARKDSPGLGQLRLTVAQFFRVNGGSTQHKGVVPDIAFPVTLDAEHYGESTYDNALPWSEIAPATHSKLADFSPLVPILTQRHGERAKQDPEFVWWSEDVAQYREQREKKSISLNLAERRSERAQIEARREQREAQRKELGLSGEDLAQSDDGLQADERAPEADAEEAEERADPLLREAAHVLVDAVDLLRRDQGLAAQVYPQRGVANTP